MQKYIFTLLIISVLLVPFAIKSLPALLGGVGLLAAAALIYNREIKIPNASPFYFTFAFLAFAAASYFWSHTPAASATTLTKLGGFIFGFMIILLWLKNINISEQQKLFFAKTIAASLTLTFIFALYAYYTPPLNALAVGWGYADFAGIFGYDFEAVRQVNRALEIGVVLLFILAAFYAPQYPKRVAGAIAAAFIITAASQSQSAALAMLLALATFAAATYSPRLATRLMLAGLAFGFISIVPLSIYSFNNAKIDALFPRMLTKEASIHDRRFIYNAYAEEINKGGTNLLFGHGIKSDHDFAPRDMQAQIDRLKTNPIMQSVADYYQSLNPKRFTHPHQIFLQVIFNFGIIGAALFLLAIGQALKYLLANTQAATQRFHLAAISALCGGFLFHTSLWRGWIMAAMILVFILAYILNRPQKQND